MLTIMRRLDIHHNDTQLTTFGIKRLAIMTISQTTKYYLLNVKIHPVTLSDVMINRCAESHYVQCRFAECRHSMYVYCHYTECRGASDAAFYNEQAGCYNRKLHS